MTQPTDWRGAADVLRKHAAMFDALAEKQEPDVCGVLCPCGPNGESLGCGFKRRHDGNHAWATLPTFIALADRPTGEGEKND